MHHGRYIPVDSGFTQVGLNHKREQTLIIHAAHRIKRSIFFLQWAEYILNSHNVPIIIIINQILIL